VGRSEAGLDALLRFDVWLFYLINVEGANRVFDAVMPFLTDFSNFEIPVAVAWVLLMIFGGKKGRVTALILALTLLLTDQLSSHVVKPLFHRSRPCAELSDVRLLVGFKNTYSFTSTHAVNIFGSATVLALAYRRLAAAFLAIAVAVAYSRVYVGVHYPLDVICGAALGAGVGACASAATWRLVRMWPRRRRSGGGGEYG
jgi:undecaprenyl-diphosphatase